MSLDVPTLKLCITALLGANRICFDSNNDSGMPELDLQGLYNDTLCVGSLEDTEAKAKKMVSLTVTLITGQSFSLKLPDASNVELLAQKLRAADKEGVVPKGPLRFFRAAKMMNNEHVLRDFNTIDDDVFICSSVGQIRFDLGFYAPTYDYDFSDHNDEAQGEVFRRGGRLYRRPCGYKRFALNVVAMYGDGAWLGKSDKPGEWAVSYHATGKSCGVSLTEFGKLFAKNNGLDYKTAVFSTPDVEFAEKFAEEFTFNGTTYMVLLQNRVDPATLTEVKTTNGTMFVSPKTGDVRPYGILFKKKP